MKTQPVRDLSIVGDFIKYSLRLFIPFFIFGAIYSFFYKSYVLSLIVNPLIYSTGISLLIIVMTYDVNEILNLVGLGKGDQLSAHIKHAKSIQEIALQMSRRDFDSALRKVNELIKKEPNFVHALNMKGEILLNGFDQPEKARMCFNKVLKGAKPTDEQYKLAEALKASTYRS